MTESYFLALKALDQLLVAWGSCSICFLRSIQGRRMFGRIGFGVFGFLVIMLSKMLKSYLTSTNIVKFYNIILDISGLIKCR